jgi:hypothetical protein
MNKRILPPLALGLSFLLASCGSAASRIKEEPVPEEVPLGEELPDQGVAEGDYGEEPSPEAETFPEEEAPGDAPAPEEPPEALTAAIPVATWAATGISPLAALLEGHRHRFWVDLVALSLAWAYAHMARATLRHGREGPCNGVWTLPRRQGPA